MTIQAYKGSLLNFINEVCENEILNEFEKITASKYILKAVDYCIQGHKSYEEKIIPTRCPYNDKSQEKLMEYENLYHYIGELYQSIGTDSELSIKERNELRGSLIPAFLHFIGKVANQRGELNGVNWHNNPNPIPPTKIEAMNKYGLYTII